LATGRKIRVLTVVDTFSRYVPVLDARFSYKGEDVVTTLDRVSEPFRPHQTAGPYSEISTRLLWK
jgi:transposase InsO family protein